MGSKDLKLMDVFSYESLVHAVAGAMVKTQLFITTVRFLHDPHIYSFWMMTQSRIFIYFPELYLLRDKIKNKSRRNQTKCGFLICFVPLKSACYIWQKKNNILLLLLGYTVIFYIVICKIIFCFSSYFLFNMNIVITCINRKTLAYCVIML